MNVGLLMRSLLSAAALCVAVPACGQPTIVTPEENSASTAAMSWPAYKARLMALARSEGISDRTIYAVIPDLERNQRVIELDRRQPGSSSSSGRIPPFAPYQRRQVTPQIIDLGQDEYRQHAAYLRSLEQRTGVDAEIILAIYGKETAYGAITGNFDLFEALGTLAWEGRRRDLFEPEFIAALKLLDQGHPRSRLKGSWAGAAGKTQFMPTNILRLAADGDGDGDADIWNSERDAFASIANYLVDAGWEGGPRWGIPVRVPADLDREAIKTRLAARRCPAVFARHSQWLPMSEWRRLGVTPVGRSLDGDTLATLIEPDGPGRTAYLTTQNYRAILDYNCSNFYALSIGLVADGIER
ncbi:lytic murein transglycosylase [Sphingomicrobium sediminis]|uniref:Lytic murein transglycosylase n=1 Tax=Sphingomicrobium sediminis TaxID=2950949 RepID=A0A9X2EK43_9SPHN|nr:lytic murein transglycosylase [Sphingomicrobium sediminis]MCM8556772.1 lytic murein transglycosylase [Sphingomicrobium sediminis]